MVHTDFFLFVTAVCSVQYC